MLNTGGNVERLFNTDKLVQDKIVKTFLKSLKNVEIKKMVDAGSGKVSASIMLKYFPNASLDAIVYPGDNRKKHPLENAIGSNRLEIIETDLCCACIRKKYDLTMAMLTLGCFKIHIGSTFMVCPHGIFTYFTLFTNVRCFNCLHIYI